MPDMKNLPSFWLAADGADPGEVTNKIDLIADVGGDYGLKINLDLVLRERKMIRTVQNLTSKPLFVDLKMNNGKRTMAEVVRMLADEGVAMTNAYALADHLLEAPAQVARDQGVVFLGVTVMTHHTDAYCQKFHGRTMVQMVRLLAQVALERGCSGYILPGTCLYNVADLDGIKFNPAIRPPWAADRKANFQEQLSTVQEAFAQGAHLVSCGSPVFDAENPQDALEKILCEVHEAKSAK